MYIYIYIGVRSFFCSALNHFWNYSTVWHGRKKGRRRLGNFAFKRRWTYWIGRIMRISRPKYYEVYYRVEKITHDQTHDPSPLWSLTSILHVRVSTFFYFFFFVTNIVQRSYEKCRKCAFGIRIHRMLLYTFDIFVFGTVTTIRL